jgi:hypothetical protein
MGVVSSSSPIHSISPSRLIIVIGLRSVDVVMAISADTLHIDARTFPIEIVVILMMAVEIE